MHREPIVRSTASAAISRRRSKEHNTDLKRRQSTYNTLRPHQALEYRTPLQKLQEFGVSYVLNEYRHLHLEIIPAILY